MNRKIVAVFLSVICVVIASPVLAESPRYLKPTIGQEKKDFREQIKTEKETIKEQFKTAREEFKTKLEGIKDENKKAIVERVNNKLTNVNANRTAHFNKVLDLLQKHLDRVKTQAGELKTKGKDTTEVDAAVVAAQATIDSARSTVSTQTAKQYVITITTEDNLRNDVGKTMKQLQQDLQTTKDAVMKAKEALIKAIIALAKLKGAEVTITVSPTP